MSMITLTSQSTIQMPGESPAGPAIEDVMKSVENDTIGTLQKSLRRMLACTALAFVLSACDSGSDSNGLDLGGNQDEDPVVVDFPIAYVKMPVPLEDGDLRELNTFNIGADLYLKKRASPSAIEYNITGGFTEGLYDVRDLDVSFDGTKVVFAMRGPFDENLDEDEQPTWNIWEYDVENDVLRRVIASDITAEAGHDVAPHYLPDGRIIFTSTRQRTSKAVLLDESKPQFEAQDENRNEPAFVLHVMSSDGSDIQQVSFNQSHDRDPTVLSNGQVMFSRWDHAPGVDGIHLFKMNPDGSDLELLYGANSHDTGIDGSIIQFAQPREMPDGRVMVLIRPFADTDFGGDISAIDVANFIENEQTTASNSGAMGGPAQEKVTVNDVRTDDQISPGGRFMSMYPLWDGTERMIVSWSQCRLQEVGAFDPDADPLTAEPVTIYACTPDRLADPLYEAARPAYGLWVYDRSEDTQLPIVPPEQGIMVTEGVVAAPRPRPPVILDKVPGLDVDPDLVQENVGVIHIRSVYDFDGAAIADIPALADPAQTSADDRPLRFVRIVKPVSMPDDDVLDFDNSAFGVSGGQGMREILAYQPIEPDGSIMMKVPANVPFAISMLDKDGRRFGPRHSNWLQVRPGEVLECNGCHDPGSGISHGRADAFLSVNDGSPTTGEPFPNTDPAIFADFGETMAQARMRISCATDCAAMTPSVDIEYEDVWTDETVRAKDEPFVYTYEELDTPFPTDPNCVGDWHSGCRITINYEAHIHPLWSTPRLILDADEVTVLEDRTCTSCHNDRDAMAAVQVPAGQLDLSDGLSDIDMDHFKAYRELLSGDNRQELVDGALQDARVEIGVDPDTGDPVFAPIGVAPSMSLAGARLSPAFFERFEAGGAHAGFLTPAELRLLSEWLDLGAQYYNNPFEAPVN